MKTDYFGHDRVYQQRRAEGSPGWDPAEVSAAVLRQFESLLAHPAVPRSGRLIEFGCGAGNLTVGFAKLDYRVTGIDLSPTAIEWAKERASELGLEIDFRVADVITLDDPRASYEVAVDGHCLHCLIGADRHAFLENARRLLVPKGILIVNTMCRNERTLEVAGFDSATCLTVHNGVATRTIATRESIEAEVAHAGFEIVASRVEVDGEAMDDLLLVARAEETQSEKSTRR